jgi:hypothetical protein
LKIKEIVNPIYNTFFPEKGNPSPIENWKHFQGGSRGDIDFSSSIEKTWRETARDVLVFLLKIIFFPWGLYEGSKALIERIVMRVIYPAQGYSKDEVNALRTTLFKNLKAQHDFIWREVTLEKNGYRYHGFVLGHKTTISNGKWAIFAPGNQTTAEEVFNYQYEKPYLDAGFNVLTINGPGVSLNKGAATKDRMGDAQEVGLCYLETAIKAKKIVLAGHSLGGAAIGQAILKHTFKKDVSYLAIRMMTFSRLSCIAKAIAGSGAETLVRWSGAEMDSVAASQKLQDKKIPEIIFEASRDALMGRVRLADALKKESLMKNKREITLDADHNDIPEDRITTEIQRWDSPSSAAQAS